VLQLGEVLHDLRICLEGARDLSAGGNSLVLSKVVGQTAQVSIWLLDVLDKVGKFQRFPQTDDGGTSLFLGGVEQDSVIDEKRLEGVGEHRESEDCSGIGQNSHDGDNSLNDVVVPSRCWNSVVNVLEDIEEHQVVVSHVLVLSALFSIQNVCVDEFIVRVHNIQRQLGEGVVDSVVVHSPVSNNSNNIDGSCKERSAGGKGVSVEASVAVERVSLVVSGVCEGGRGDYGTLVYNERNGMEA